MDSFKNQLDPAYGFKQDLHGEVDSALLFELQNQSGTYSADQQCLSTDFIEASVTGQSNHRETNFPEENFNESLKTPPLKRASTKSWLFTKGYGQKIYKGDEVKIKCCVEGCTRVYKANKGSTSSIAYHLLSAHNISEFPSVPGPGTLKPSQVKKYLKPKTKQMQQESDLVCSTAFQFKQPEPLPSTLYNQNTANSFKGCIPFPVIQDDALLNFLQLTDTCTSNVSLLPTDILPSQYIDPNFQDYKLKIKQTLSRQSSISLSIAQLSDSLFITAHFIDESWASKEVLLTILSLKDRGMASDLAKLLMGTLNDFKIADKIFTITTDLSPTMVLLADELFRISAGQGEIKFKPHQHIPCLGHVINLVTNGVLCVDLNNLPHDPKEVIEYLGGTSGVASGSIFDRLTFLREGMTAIRNSPPKLAIYQSYFKQKGLAYQEPLVDTLGDWEGTLAMVSRAIVTCQAYNFACSTFGVTRLSISQDSLSFLEEIKAFLGLFQAFSIRVSTCRYPSLTMTSVMRDRLLKHLEAVGPQKPVCMRSAYEFSRLAFTTYYSQGFLSEIYPIAIAVDPRLKLNYWKPPVCSYTEAETLCAKVKAYWDAHSNAPYLHSAFLPLRTSFDDVFDIDTGLESDELARYSQESVINASFFSEAEVLEFWKRSSLSFPSLSKIAQKFLTIPISSRPCDKRQVHSKMIDPPSFASSNVTFKLKAEFSLLNNWRNSLE